MGWIFQKDFNNNMPINKINIINSTYKFQKKILRFIIRYDFMLQVL